MKKRPVGVIVLGVLFILTSLDSLRLMPGYDLYRQVNHDCPNAWLLIRFAGSYIFRLVGLFGGIGLLCLNDPVRRFLIGFSWYCLLTLPLRHTYSAQFFYSEPLYRQNGSMFSLEVFTWIAVIVRWLIDGVFSAAVIFYLSRAKVRERFCP